MRNASSFAQKFAPNLDVSRESRTFIITIPLTCSVSRSPQRNEFPPSQFQRSPLSPQIPLTVEGRKSLYRSRTPKNRNSLSER